MPGPYPSTQERAMSKPEDQVTIPAQELEELREDQRKLNALETAGVDNWEGYDNAMEILHGE